MRRYLRWILGDPDSFINGKTRALRMMLSLVLIIGLVACATPPPVTTPPVPVAVTTQSDIQNVNKLLSDSANSEVKAVIALRDQGKVSQADTTVVLNYSAAVANFSEGLNTIVTAALANGTTLAAERAQIVSLVQATVLPAIGSSVSPTAAAVIATVSAVFSQLKGLVGL